MVIKAVNADRLLPYLMYMVAWAATAGSDLVLLPILSRILSPDEYGIYVLVSGVTVFLADTVSVWASTFFVRCAPAQSDPDARKRLRTILLGAVLIVGLIALAGQATIGAAIAYAGHDHLSRAFFAGAFLVPALGIYTFAQADFQSASRSASYTLFALGRLVFMAVGGMTATWIMARSATNYLLGASLGVLPLILPYLLLNLRNNPFTPGARSVIRDAFHFGVGLWFQNLGAKLLRIGDRYIVAIFLGTSAAGVYAAGYALLFGAGTLAIAPLLTLVTPMVFRKADISGDDAVAAVLRRLLSMYMPGITILSGLVLATSPVFMPILLPASFAEFFSPPLVFALLAAAGIHGVTLLVNLIFAVKKRTLISAKLFALIATVNVLGNLILVPAFAIAGAIWVNLAAYGGLLLATWVIAQRHITIGLPRRIISLSSLAVGGMFAVTILLKDAHEIFVSLAILLWLAVWIGALVVLNPESHIDIRGGRLREQTTASITNTTQGET